jgi:hypothetical protein
MVEIYRPVQRRQVMPVEAITTLVLGGVILLGLAVAVMSGYVPLPGWLHI